ncbi:MAG TPA: aldolase/citrate lyase family protein [Candidatus Heimdallarchaeota archaeon]|nr:aldolase/citrate lyase family protein [Candidatus Heimdallarchaeota archaeon]
MKESFRQRLKQGDLLIGTFMTLPSSEIAEIFAETGYDWLFVDMEHTTLDVKDVQCILQAVGKKCSCIVRVPSSDETWLKKVLDAGVDGVIIPHVNTADEVRRIVKTCLYPPEGSRSVGLARAQKYGLQFEDYVKNANQTVAIIPQIEHIDGVQNIEEIVKVPGISAIFIGPYDLSGSLGKLGEIHDPQVQKSIAKIYDSCTQAGLPVGIFSMDTEVASFYIEHGFTLITVGMDILFIGDSAKDTLRKLRK